MSRPMLLAVGIALTPAVLSGCEGRNEAVSPSASPDLPSFTVGANLTSATLARANAGPFHVQSKYAGFDVELKTHDNADVVVASLSAAPGGYSGWHSHPGPVIVTIKTGSLTVYDADDPDCAGTVHAAGTVFLERGGDVHFARNESGVTAEWVSTYIIPAGGATRIDAPAPGNCPF